MKPSPIPLDDRPDGDVLTDDERASLVAFAGVLFDIATMVRAARTVADVRAIDAKLDEIRAG